MKFMFFEVFRFFTVGAQQLPPPGLRSQDLSIWGGTFFWSGQLSSLYTFSCSIKPSMSIAPPFSGKFFDSRKRSLGLIWIFFAPNFFPGQKPKFSCCTGFFIGKSVAKYYPGFLPYAIIKGFRLNCSYKHLQRDFMLKNHESNVLQTEKTLKRCILFFASSKNRKNMS